jgi:hypothetical protein
MIQIKRNINVFGIFLSEGAIVGESSSDDVLMVRYGDNSEQSVIFPIMLKSLGKNKEEFVDEIRRLNVFFKKIDVPPGAIISKKTNDDKYYFFNHHVQDWVETTKDIFYQTFRVAEINKIEIVDNETVCFHFSSVTVVN